jgi:hypothetical protein
MDGIECDKKYLEVITSLETIEKKSNHDEQKNLKNLKTLKGKKITKKKNNKICRKMRRDIFLI